TSGYAPMGAVIVSDQVAEPFLEPGRSFVHGLTFGGHPVAAAAALANPLILDRQRPCERAETVGPPFREQLESLRALPIVGDVRGIGMFQAIELIRPGSAGERPTPEQTETLMTIVPNGVFEAGVICRAMHRGAPVLQFAPPLIAAEEDL